MHEPEYRCLPLYDRHGTLKDHTLIDAADEAWVNRWTWRLLPTGYVGRTEWVKGTGRSQLIFLHRALNGLIKGDKRQVDHRDRDRLNNRRSNLRVVTAGQQAQNRPSPKHARSNLRGVIWCPDRNCWRGRVTVNGKTYNGPRTKDEHQAAEWAREMRLKVMTHAEG